MIESARAEIHGQLSDKARVIDRLLDIRLAGADNSSLVAEVDRQLADVPGLTTVENDWWAAALDALQLAASPVPLG